MPRSGPVYTLPEAAFVPNTPISSAAVNDDFSDIAAALTASLARNGAGGMQAILPLDNTGFNYLTDPNTGIRRDSADTQVIFCGGTDTVLADTGGILVTGAVNSTLPMSQGGFVVRPVGEITMYGGAAAPAGWLLCDGSSLLRSAYPNLFTAIGVIYGAVDGSHFNVPDLRGRMPAGPDGGTGRITTAGSGVNGAVLGTGGGAQNQTISQAQLPAATLATAIVDPGHTHTVGPSSLTSVSYTAGGTSTGNLQTTTATGTPANQTAASHATGITASTALGGSGAALTTMPPVLIVSFIIYAGV